MLDISDKNKVIIIQADNPDGDSLASALALENILGDMGKEVSLYCGVDMPDYLKYMQGWDRVSKDLYKDVPCTFDLSIIVDTSADSLLEQIKTSPLFGHLKHTPCIVIDHHHEVEASIPYATEVINREGASTTELIYSLAKENNWPLSKVTLEYIVYGILSDSLGLTTDSVTGNTVHTIAECVDAGVSLAELEEKRREYNKKTQDIYHYKGRLLERTEFSLEGRLASVTIPWAEIHEFSQSYNPAMLVLDEMRMVEGVEIAIVFKLYKDGKITGKIRCNRSAPIANKLAESFGGGGHAYAAGFKIQNGTNYTELRSRIDQTVFQLLENKD